MITKVGELVEHITQAVRTMDGITPYSEIVVREGDYGDEVSIENLKVRQTLTGPKLILQLKARE